MLLSLAATSASAVIWGTKDGNKHPYVAMIIFDVNGSPSWRCSGALLNSRTVLTAAHCTYGATGARVWTDSDLRSNNEYPFGGSTSVEGTPHSHPSYNDFAGFPQTYDVGVVKLSQSINLSKYAKLPSIGEVNTKAKKGRRDNLTVVGYGLQAVRPSLQADPVRYYGDPRIINLNNANTGSSNIQITANNGQADGGGSCFGDSGGPALFKGSNTVAGVGSFVLNKNCVGTGFYYRVDTNAAQSFVRSHM